jgi:hypothetical protein
LARPDRRGSSANKVLAYAPYNGWRLIYSSREVRNLNTGTHGALCLPAMMGDT